MPWMRTSALKNTTVAMTILVCASLFAGCAKQYAVVGVKAPNHDVEDPSSLDISDAIARNIGIDEQIRITVGPPEASIRVWQMNPITDNESEEEEMIPRGTIFVLHGIRVDSISMLGNAKEFAREGYRVFLIDHRGHGGSTGKWLTYGVQESIDLTQVMTELERQNRIVHPIGMYGISYGGATTIQTTGRDQRIKAAVSVAGFGDARKEVRDFTRFVAPLYTGHMMSDADYDKMLNHMGDLASFNPEDADARIAMAKIRVPVLLIHGKNDGFVPYYHAEELNKANPEYSEIYALEGDGHASIWLDAQGEVSKASINWFNVHLSKHMNKQQLEQTLRPAPPNTPKPLSSDMHLIDHHIPEVTAESPADNKTYGPGCAIIRVVDIEASSLQK